MRSLTRAPFAAGVLASAAVLTLLAAAQRGGAPSGPPAALPPAEPAPAQRSGGTGARTPAAGDRAARGATPRESGAPEAPPQESEPELPLAERAPQYFAIADYNANGRLSFEESRLSLGLDRGGFAVYDKNKDGLIDYDEFAARYQTILEKGGAFQPPLEKPKARKPPRREAPLLLEDFDQTHDDVLDEREFERVLKEYEVKQPPPAELFATLDRDASKALELVELEALADIASPKAPDADERAEPKPESILALFGRSLPREERIGATHLPPQVRGPVPVFRRLDLDDDGEIELEDLVELQRPVQLPIRLNAVFSVLDTDGDQRLSRRELAESMRPKGR